MDAIATPFVQGQLKDRVIEASIHTECAHCQQAIEIEIDSRLAMRAVTAGARPVISTPLVNLKRLKAPNIIDAF